MWILLARKALYRLTGETSTWFSRCLKGYHNFGPLLRYYCTLNDFLKVALWHETSMGLIVSAWQTLYHGLKVTSLVQWVLTWMFVGHCAQIHKAVFYI